MRAKLIDKIYIVNYLGFILLLSCGTTSRIPNSITNASCAHDEKNFRCVKYVKNYDADTVTFDVPNVHPLLGKKINIRVDGVDTPELRTVVSLFGATSEIIKVIFSITD